MREISLGVPAGGRELSIAALRIISIAVLRIITVAIVALRWVWPVIIGVVIRRTGIRIIIGTVIIVRRGRDDAPRKSKEKHQ
jgi:hypothetical protein